MPLSEILSVEKSSSTGESGDPVYCFAIKTASVVFYVGEDSATNEVSFLSRHQQRREAEKDEVKDHGPYLSSCYSQTEAGAAPNKEAVAEFEAAIRSAVTPVVKTSSEAGAITKEDNQASAAPVKETKVVTVKVPEKEKEGRETEISKAYQIFPDEVLGSGQFGIVYGGVHR